MRRIFVILFIAMLLMMNIGSGLTQETQEPLLYALSFIPNKEDSRNEMIIFADIEALETAYGTERPASPAEYRALQFAENPEDDPAMVGQLAWWRTLRSFGLPSELYETLDRDYGNTTIGITFFQIDATISYGTPPDHALMLFGEFDQSAVRAAYTEKGYAQQPGMNGEIWCGAAGCKAGNETNPRQTEPENPFGGELGRNQPVVIGENYLMSSPQMVMVEAHAAVAASSIGSLADDPRYQAAVEAVTQEGTLVQALILDQLALLEMTQQIVPELAISRYPEEAGAILSTFLENYETLPVYNLLMIADIVTETDQVVQLALVFSDAADAQIAAQVLATRIQNYTSLFYKRPLVEMLADLFIEIHEPILYSDVEDHVVVVLTFSTPRPADLNELIAVTTLSIDNDTDILWPGYLHLFFTTALSQQDIGWLSMLSREELEAIVQKLEVNN